MTATTTPQRQHGARSTGVLGQRRRRGAGATVDATYSPTQLRRRALVYRTAVLLVVVVVWEVLGRTVVDSDVLSRPSAIGPRLVEQFGDADVTSALAYTAKSILVAFVVGCLIGIVIGSLLGLVRLLHDAFMRPLLFVMSIPKVIFLPVFVLIFGIGSHSAEAFAAFEACVYVAVCVTDGMALIQRKHLRVARAFRASWTQRLRVVIFPSAMPGIFTGMWFGMKHAFAGVLTAELWASSNGVGALTRSYSESLRTDDALALVITVSILAILLGTLWSLVETRLTRWK